MQAVSSLKKQRTKYNNAKGCETIAAFGFFLIQSYKNEMAAYLLLYDNCFYSFSAAK